MINSYLITFLLSILRLLLFPHMSFLIYSNILACIEYVVLNLSPTSLTGRTNRLRAAHDVHPVREVRRPRRRDVRTALSPTVLRRNQGEHHIAHSHAITREFSSFKTRGVYIVFFTTSNDQYMRTCVVCVRKFRWACVSNLENGQSLASFHWVFPEQPQETEIHCCHG